ncbi:SCO7613 C-terminal domain-containing membrane protein [Mycetocola zhadangensis]|uniref:SCO7613 C-terminal domain-containing membrane protein n=1 Tax=Mycetocola zhadangensis TaxID=1164595 RepID=UPI003A4DB631
MSSTSGFPPPSAFAALPASDVPGAGRWPVRPEFLTDTTRCPSCFTVLTAASFAVRGTSTGPVCGNCGLDLSGSEASEVFAAGQTIVATETRRQQLLHQMRADQAERDARARTVAEQYVPVQPPTPQNVPMPAPSPVSTGRAAPVGAPLSALYPDQPTPPTPSSGMPSEPPRPRRSGVQILMLTVGVILVSIMAIFFVLLAYLVASLEVRSVLTAVASVAVFGVAWLLHRRRLTGTAQGIAILAVVLLLLDIWIVRANDLFGSGGIDGWLYAGIATALLAGALALGFRVLPLRSLSISAVLLAPFAVFATTLGVLAGAGSTVPVWAALTAVAAAALAWPLIHAGAVERVLLRVIGFIAASLGILPAFFIFPEWEFAPILGLAVVASVWLGHLVLSPFSTAPASSPTALPSEPTPATSTTVPQILAALGLGLAVAAIGPALWFRLSDITTFLWVPAVAAMIGAVVLSTTVRTRFFASRASLLTLSAAVPVAVAVLAITPAALAALSNFALIVGVPTFSVAIVDDLPVALANARWTVPGALIGIGVLGACLLAVLNRVSRAAWAWAPLAFAALGLTAASFALATPALASAGLLALGVAGLFATASVRLPHSYRLVAALSTALCTLGLFLVGLTNTVIFPFTVLATLTILVTFRDIIRRTTVWSVARWFAPVLVASAIASLLVSVWQIPLWTQTVTGNTAAQASPALLISLVALAAFGTIPLVAALLWRAEAAAAGGVALIALAIGVVELAGRIAADSVPFLVVAGLTVGVAVVWQCVPRVAAWPERFIAALVAPPLTVSFAAVLCDRFDPAVSLVSASAAVVVLAASALIVFRSRSVEGAINGGNDVRTHVEPSRLARIGWDVATALSAALLTVQAASGHLGWLAFLFLAVAALLIGSGEGGVLRGQTPRRHSAWAALPLAVAALWTALSDNSVTVIEWYTVPVAGLLFVILALVVVRRRPLSDGPERTLLLAAALSLLLLPSAIAAEATEPLRGVLVITITSLAFMASPFLPAVVRNTALAAVVATVAAASGLVVVVSLGVRGEGSGWHNEIVAGALLVGGFLWRSRGQKPRDLGTVTVALAPVVLALPTTVLLIAGSVAPWEYLLALAFACVLFVVYSLRTNFSSLIRWTALSAAILLAITGLATGTADPFEWATLPIAVALLTAGALRLASDPTTRSWSQLGTGLVVLLVPSLLVDWGVTELWRVVALGVVALVVLGAGLALRLMAPTLLGAAVLVLHGLAQLWPWISGLYGAIPWWLWAGIGGVVLITLAATYEKRIRDLRAVARSISSLR